MTLRPVVVPARDVRHDEPRWWCEDGEKLGDDVSHFQVDDLHDLDPEDVRDLDRAGWPFLAIVVRDDGEQIAKAPVFDHGPHVCLGCGVFQDDIDAHRCPTPRSKAEPTSDGEAISGGEYIRRLEAALLEAADDIAGCSSWPSPAPSEVKADHYRTMIVVGRCARDGGEAVFLRADVLEVIRGAALPNESDADTIARMVWAATRPGGTVAEPISPGR